jgi:hypothetical protein
MRGLAKEKEAVEAVCKLWLSVALVNVYIVT